MQQVPNEPKMYMICEFIYGLILEKVLGYAPIPVVLSFV